MLHILDGGGTVCGNVGLMTIAMCHQVLHTSPVCSAATFKERQCWLHDRHDTDFWHDDVKSSNSGGNKVLSSVLYMRMTDGIDSCH